MTASLRWFHYTTGANLIGIIASSRLLICGLGLSKVARRTGPAVSPFRESVLHGAPDLLFCTPGWRD